MVTNIYVLDSNINSFPECLLIRSRKIANSKDLHSYKGDVRDIRCLKQNIFVMLQKSGSRYRWSDPFRRLKGC